LKKTFWYASAICGAGKTYALVRRAISLCAKGHKVLIAQPTNLLAKITYENEFKNKPDGLRVTVFNRDTMGDGVAKQLAKYLASPLDDGPEVVICSHQVLGHLPFLSTGGNWDLLIDECPQVHREISLNLRNTHAMITDCVTVLSYNESYSKLIVTGDDVLKEIARNKHGDEVYDVLQEPAQILLSPRWETFVKNDAHQRLLDGKGKSLTCHAILRPTVLLGFRSLFICGANFENSGVFKLWRKEISWRRDTAFEKGLRSVSHTNGSSLTIYYALDEHWSRVKRDAVSADRMNLARIRDAALKVFNDRPFVWQGNKSIDDRFFEDSERLPNNPLGLNDYTEIHNLVFLSALNPSPAHCAFLIDRGVKPNEIARMQYLETVYQSVMRISLRDPTDFNPKTVIVPDLRAAEYLAEKIPGATIRKLETGIVEEAKKPGRKKKYGSNAEKSREWRKKKQDENREYLLRLLRPAQDQMGDCSPIMRNETTIDILSNFVTDHPCWGTFYRTKKSKNAHGYLQYGSHDELIEILESFHQQKYDSKESAPLLGPAMFDPAKAEETNRGFANIVSVQNLWLDFDGGDLSPDGFAAIFPDLEMVIINTFNHTAEVPRFRVIIMIDQPIPPEVYEVLWDQIEVRLEDSGYVRKPLKNSNHGRSGLDGSKRSAASLFRLPSQAKNPSDSFFHVYKSRGRKPLNPEDWIKSARIDISEWEYIDAPVLQPPSTAVEQSKVDEAVAIWRSSPITGHAFFMLGVRLRDLGMDPYEIEAILRAEAQVARSPAERKRQIPSIMKSLRKYAAKSPA